MQRRLVRICVFLLLGAIVNVAVGWGLTLSRGIGSQRNMPERIFPEASAAMLAKWTEYRPDVFAIEADSGFELDHLGFVAATLYANSFQQAVIMIAGLPSPSLIGYRFERIDSAGWRVDANTFVRLPKSGGGDDPETWLPLRPIWPGFAINTVFYAAGLWLLFAGPSVVRRWRRIRRGLCPKCAYDLRGSVGETCPECGTATARTAKSP